MVGLSLILLLMTELSILQSIFDTVFTDLRQQWGICFSVALIFLFVSELVKFIFRLFAGKDSEAA